jgi:hypothetical protein
VIELRTTNHKGQAKSATADSFIFEVTKCLSPKHGECNGAYADSTRTYLVKCCCPCHGRRDHIISIVQTA